MQTYKMEWIGQSFNYEGIIIIDNLDAFMDLEQAKGCVTEIYSTLVGGIGGNEPLVDLNVYNSQGQEVIQFNRVDKP